MPIAAIYDIHGNLPALEAVLDEISQAEVDGIVVGGDIVAGPMPRETLERLLLLELPVYWVRGNADRQVVACFDRQMLQGVPAHVEELTRWTAQQLDRAHRDFLAALPLTIDLDIAGAGPVCFCHATARNDEEIFTRITPEERVRSMFEQVAQLIVVCGHTHMQFDRQVGGKRLINAGSVGMPYGTPGAYWALIGPHIQLKRTSYDLVQAGERILATSFPQASDFALHNVQNPPTEQEALAVFEAKATG